MNDDGLPKYSQVDELAGSRRSRRRHRRRHAMRVLVFAGLTYIAYAQCFVNRDVSRPSESRQPQLLSVIRLLEEHAQCSKLRSVPTDPSGPRAQNARYNGGRSVLIKNATVWTGDPALGISADDAHIGKGYAWVHSDVLLEQGLIKRVEPSIAEGELSEGYMVYDACGRQLTSGIVDMHSHAGDSPLPATRGGDDDNELSSDITPYVRSLDAINPLDHQIQVIKSGGVTTSLILPGSGNNIGGEAYVIKHAVGKPDGRPEISTEDLLADPDRNWRYMKMACGENPKRVYGKAGRDFGPFSRMGEAWYFRHAFEQATAFVKSQDDWCGAADRLGAENMSEYLPMDLQWESLGALLRGQVLLNTHCYTVPDLEAFIRHTNEFKFKVRAFHHAHQTYLVPEILKRAYGGRPPAAALFANNMYYKVESYIGSEQAGKILYENGITPVYVSDNPVLNAQHVIFEAAKAYMNGLPYYVALAGVTSASAELLGLGDRIGKVKPGFDADIVVWDSDPLSVGATPMQVWIDGAPQFDEPVELKKPVSNPLGSQALPLSTTETAVRSKTAVLRGVSKVVLSGLEQTLMPSDHVIITNGTISCTGQCLGQIAELGVPLKTVVHLHDGHIVPPATAFGSFLGMEEIQAEADTKDGANDDSSFSAAVDGLALDTKSLRAAYAHDVAKAITAPAFQGGGHKGVSVGFRTGAKHALKDGAVFASTVAVHYTLALSAKQGKTPSLSSAIAALKIKLLKAVEANETTLEPDLEQQDLYRVVNGRMPLVITVHSADIIANVIRLKAQVEKAIELEWTGHEPAPKLRMAILGGAESHLLAKELAEAKIGVILAPAYPYAVSWDQKRSLTGAPLTNGTAVDALHAAGVTVALGTDEDSQTRDLYLMAGVAHANSGGKISEKEAVAMISSNIYDMLGMKEDKAYGHEFAVFEGSPLEINSRLRAVADGRGSVSLWT